MTRNHYCVFVAASSLLNCVLCTHASAQTAATKSTVYAGCATSLPQAKEMLVLATADACYLLSGSAPADIAGHQVQLSAALIPQQGMQPITLQVTSVKSVKAACSQTCILQPPGTRGLGPKDKPGREGGTPGVTSSPQP